MNYLYVIAGNLCKNALRSRREIVFSQLGEENAKKILPKAEKDFGTGIRSRKETEESELHVVQIDLEQAVRQMPEELREVVILYYFQELKLREIAGILEIGLPLVKYRMKKAKEHLKSVLGEDYL